MGTAFDDFIKSPQHNKPVVVVRKAQSHIQKSTPAPRPLPQIRKHVKKYSATTNTEFSGKDFQPRAAHGYPKGALNVLIVFFATFIEEIWDMMTKTSDSGVLDD